MKANELMIGDWVLDTEFERNEPDRIGIVEDDGRVWLKNRNSYQSVTYCEPIPLTPEILEKNFELKGERYYCGDEFNDIDINEYTDGLWEVTVWNVEIGMLDCKAYVCCVHELQHVLRLCEIDKEIEI